MINTIIDAISVSLNTEFGDDYRVYTESLKQDLTEPCFFILCLNPTNELYRGHKYKRTNQFCIHYFPLSNDEKNSECLDVLDRLYECLEVINLGDGDLQRGTSMHADMNEGVLQFFVNYDFFMRKPAEETKMETIDIDSRARG